MYVAVAEQVVEAATAGGLAGLVVGAAPVAGGAAAVGVDSEVAVVSCDLGNPYTSTDPA